MLEGVAKAIGEMQQLETGVDYAEVGQNKILSQTLQAEWRWNITFNATQRKMFYQVQVFPI
jgi:hypothetical protein